MILANLYQIRDGFSSLSAYPQDERLNLDGYEISHARGDESFSNRSKKNPERMQNRTLARHQAYTNYRKITRQSILSSAATRTKEAGRGTGRKFTSKDLAEVSPLPLVLSHLPLDAVAGPLSRIAWHSKSGAPPKLFRTIIITYPERHRRNLLLNIVSGMRRLRAGETGRSLWEEKKKQERERERRRVKFSSRFVKTWESQGVYDTNMCCVTVDEYRYSRSENRPCVLVIVTYSLE